MKSKGKTSTFLVSFFLVVFLSSCSTLFNKMSYSLPSTNVYNVLSMHTPVLPPPFSFVQVSRGSRTPLTSTSSLPIFSTSPSAPPSAPFSVTSPTDPLQEKLAHQTEKVYRYRHHIINLQTYVSCGRRRNWNPHPNVMKILTLTWWNHGALPPVITRTTSPQF